MSTENQPRTYDRTHYEALLDVQYGVVYNRLNERFFDRLDMLMGAIGLLGGSSAAAAALAKDPKLAAIAGVTLACVSIIERVLGAARKAEQHKQAVVQYSDLLARAPKMSLAAIDAELARLRGSLPHGIDALAMVAYNRNVRTNGRPDYAGTPGVVGWLLSLVL